MKSDDNASQKIQLLLIAVVILVTGALGAFLSTHSHDGLQTTESTADWPDMSNYVECAECGVLVAKNEAIAERKIERVAGKSAYGSEYNTLVYAASGYYYGSADIDIDRNDYFIATTYYCTHCKPKKTVSNIWFSPSSSSIHYTPDTTLHIDYGALVDTVDATYKFNGKQIDK